MGIKIIEKFSQAAFISSNTAKWRRYTHSNKSDFDGISLVMEDIRQTISNIAELKAKQNEAKVFNLLKNRKNLIYAGDAENPEALNSPPTYDDFIKIVDHFWLKKAKKFSMFNRDYKDDSSLSYRKSIEPYYFAFGHTDLRYDLHQIKDFQPVYNYSGHKFDGEVGTLLDIKFILLPIYGSDSIRKNFKDTIYSIIVLARDSFGMIMGTNELKILNEDWIYQLDCKASDFSI